MPLVLAIAPNGAIMGGFPNKFTEEELLNAFGSPCTERCMKALQDGKLVFLCVQNSATNYNDEALEGVREFKADERFAKYTEVVMLDPSDTAETSFLADLKIDPKESEAVTAFLVPPGSVIAEFKGATNKDEIDRGAPKGKHRLRTGRMRAGRMRTETIVTLSEQCLPTRSHIVCIWNIPSPFY